MRKKNILNLLFEDLKKQIDLEESNFNSCIDDYNKCINDYIIPFIVDNQETFNLDFKFDLNSNDEIIRNKSTLLKEVLIYDFKKLLSTNPHFFKYHLGNGDYKNACDITCYTIMAGNIEEYKRYLQEIK